MAAASAHAPLAAVARPAERSVTAVRVLDSLLLATLALAPITKLYIEPLGRLVLSNVLGIVFVLAFLAVGVHGASWRASAGLRVLGVFFALFTCVYLAGYVGMGEQVFRTQWAKAFAVWIAHGGFMLCAAWHLVRRGLPLMERAMVWLLVGFTVSGGWALLQLAGVVLGFSPDRILMSVMPFSPQKFGEIKYHGGGLYRAPGLTLDPNHLGVMMSAPIVLAITWLRGGVLRVAVVAVCFVALVLTLSRSGALGFVAAMLVLAWQWRARLLRPVAIVAIAGAASAIVAGIALLARFQPQIAESLILGRLDVGGRGAQSHLGLYALVPDLLGQAPFVGHGLNSFALLFAELSGGREGFGPHSHYVRILVETGLLGTLLFAGFAAWLLARLHVIGGMRAAGLAAAVVGLLIGNVFYLTTQILYADVLYAFAAAAPLALGAAAVRRTADADSSGAAAAHPTSHPSGMVSEPPVGPWWRRSLRRLHRRFWWLVFAGALVGLLAVWIAGGSKPVLYQASTLTYLGQPVGRSGSLLKTLGSNAATGLEYARSNRAVNAASQAAGVDRARVRRGLSATAVQSSLGNRKIMPPAMIRVTMRDRDPRVADASVEAVTHYLSEAVGGFGHTKVDDLEHELEGLEAQLARLRRVRGSASNAGGGSDSALAAVATSQILALQTAVAETRSELASARELEQVRVVDVRRAAKVGQPGRAPAYVRGAVLGALVGLVLAVVLGGRAARRRDQSS